MMTDMEMQMVRALAAIDAELGMPEDGCNSTEATLTAIRLLHAVHRDDTAEIRRLHKDADRLRMLLGGEHELDALAALLAEPHGCVFCDSGKLRNPAKPHEPGCGFLLAERVLPPNVEGKRHTTARHTRRADTQLRRCCLSA